MVEERDLNFLEGRNLIEAWICLNVEKTAHKRKILPFAPCKSTLTSEDNLSDV